MLRRVKLEKNTLLLWGRRYGLYAAAALALLLIAAIFLLRTGLTVQVEPVVRGPAVEAVYATGTVEPVRWAKVGPKATGRIHAILAKEGDKVARGAVLARLDDREARANGLSLAAREEFLRAEESRMQELFAKQLISRQVYEKAVSDHEQALESLNAARQVLNDLALTAPLAGTVIRQDGQVGEIVSSQSVLFWVGDAGQLWVVADVDEEDIPRIRKDQRVLIKADAFLGQALEGVVAEITPKGDPVNKTYRVRIALPATTPLKVGMTTEVNIVVREQADALLVPATALVDGQVWLVREGQARRVPVKLGVVGTQKVQVLAGVAEGEFAIAYPPATLKDGMRVRALSP